jgi:DNA-binding NarL/FixJ family response regulator
MPVLATHAPRSADETSGPLARIDAWADLVIRVLIVDDHRLVRAGLVTLLSTTDDLEVVAEAADGGQALDCVGEVTPDVVLMDISMPGVDGITATRDIMAAHPDTRVVALTSSADDRSVADMLAAGAIGYVLKDSEPEQLIGVIRAAAMGQVPIDPRVAGALLPSRSQPAEHLSDRELQVLRLAARGLANKQIGRELGIAERTVKVHLGSVFRRIGVADRTSAAVWAREHLGAEDAPSRCT